MPWFLAAANGVSHPCAHRIDAPCSSDRHIAQQAASNRGIIPAAHWSVKGCKKAADLQLQVCSCVQGYVLTHLL